MQRLQLRIPEIILQDARKVAIQRGRTPAHMLRRALTIGLAEIREDERRRKELESRK